jgi:hypothetical protein
MDTKNIPVFIYAQYFFFTNIYLSYLINKSLHSFNSQLCSIVLLYPEKSHCSLAIFRVKARLGCCDRSLLRTVGQLHVTQVSGAFIH